MSAQIIVGGALAELRKLPTESVHCIVTSPPYYGLRDYGVEGQIGLERTIGEYLEAMVAVFQEARRVLRKDGVCWINMGDSYAGSPGGFQGKHGDRFSRTFQARIGQSKGGVGLKSKDMCGVPWRLAFALQDDGWSFRQDNVWSKNNPMPESVYDRFTKSHEYIFMFARSNRTKLWRARDTLEWSWCKPDTTEMVIGANGRPARRWRGFDYYFDQQAVAEPCSENTHARRARNGAHKLNDRQIKVVAGWAHGAGIDAQAREGDGRKLMRDVGVGHGARPSKAVPNTGVGFGHGYDAVSKPRVKNNDSFDAAMAVMPSMRNKRSVWTMSTEAFPGAHFATFPTALARICILAGCPPGGVVLDMFAGACTTGLVAERLQRHSILIEIGPHYAEMGRRRMMDDAPLLTTVEMERVAP